MPGADELRDELRRLLGAQGEDAAARLIGEARAEAHARVLALLADAYTDVLLDRVRLALGPGREAAGAAEARRATAPAPGGRAAAPGRAERSEEPGPSEATEEPGPSEATEAPAPEELGWYVYCVVGGDQSPPPDDLEGVDPHHPVRALEQDGLAAIVSRVSLAEFGEEPLREHLSDLEWLERTARRHEQVQAQVARAGTPIPMRLCSIYRDESGVRSMLVREGATLAEALDHLRGKAEWGVKAFADPDAGQPVPPVSKSASGSGEGAAYMEDRLRHRRRSQEIAARVDDACDSVHAALGAIAIDGVILSPHRPEMTGRDVPMVFNASYLVADADADDFHSELDRLRDELTPLGIDLEQTGPWPPYNFVPGAIGAGW